MHLGNGGRLSVIEGSGLGEHSFRVVETAVFDQSPCAAGKFVLTVYEHLFHGDGLDAGRRYFT